MTTYRVAFSPRARSQLRAIAEWWAEHRAERPTLVADELDALLGDLERGLLRGTAYAPSPPARRALLARSRYHVYYDANREAGVVHILAVWHAARGGEPRL